MDSLYTGYEGLSYLVAAFVLMGMAGTQLLGDRLPPAVRAYAVLLLGVTAWLAIYHPIYRTAPAAVAAELLPVLYAAMTMLGPALFQLVVATGRDPARGRRAVNAAWAAALVLAALHLATPLFISGLYAYENGHGPRFTPLMLLWAAFQLGLVVAAMRLLWHNSRAGERRWVGVVLLGSGLASASVVDLLIGYGIAVPFLGPFLVPFGVTLMSVGMWRLWRGRSAAEAPAADDGRGLAAEVATTHKDHERLLNKLDHVRQACAVAKEQLQQGSRRDPLTGLYARRYLEESLERLWVRALADAEPLAVVVLELDGWAAFCRGRSQHEADRVLREVALVLRDAVQRPGDLLGRFSGERFLIVLPGTDGGGAEVVARRAQRLVAQLNFTHERPPLPLLLRTGTAAASPGQDPEPNLPTLLHQADRALAAARAEPPAAGSAPSALVAGC